MPHHAASTPAPGGLQALRDGIHQPRRSAAAISRKGKSRMLLINLMSGSAMKPRPNSFRMTGKIIKAKYMMTSPTITSMVFSASARGCRRSRTALIRLHGRYREFPHHPISRRVSTQQPAHGGEQLSQDWQEEVNVVLTGRPALTGLRCVFRSACGAA